MKKKIIVATLALTLCAGIGVAQQTPKSSVEAYAALADAILALDKAEELFIKGLLDGHLHGAKAHMRAERFDAAAAEMILFANEGDNAIAGIRKRLLEGGHHHHADDGSADSEYEPGYVIVTRAAKIQIMEAAGQVRTGDEESRATAWEGFLAIADELLKKE